MSDEELDEFADYLWDQHESYREARRGQGGRRTDTQMDEGMKDTLETLREIEDEMHRREEGQDEPAEDDGEPVDPQELWNSPVVVYEEMRDEELEDYSEFLWDMHEEANAENDDETMREVMSELREVDREQLSRE